MFFAVSSYLTVSPVFFGFIVFDGTSPRIIPEAVNLPGTVALYARAVCYLCSDARSHIYTTTDCRSTAYLGAAMTPFEPYTHAVLSVYQQTLLQISRKLYRLPVSSIFIDFTILAGFSSNVVDFDRFWRFSSLFIDSGGFTDFASIDLGGFIDFYRL